MPIRRLLVTLVALAAPIAHATDDATRSVLENVASVPAPGVPGTLVAFTENAFPILVNEQGETILAGARVGEGRVIVFGHGGLLDTDDGDADTLRANIARLLAGDRPAVRAFGLPEPAAETLRSEGLRVDHLDDLPEDLGDVDLIFGSIHALAREHGRGIEDLRAWLRAGGALLAADTAWGYLQLKHAKTLAELPCNRLMHQEGLAWTNTLRDAPGGKAYTVPDDPAPRTANALAAARALAAGEPLTDRERTAAVASIAETLAAVPGPADLLAVLDAQSARPDVRAAFAAMGETPLTPDANPLACVLLDLDAARWTTADASTIEAHPSAAAFPGAVPSDAERVETTITLKTSIPGWRTTGYYTPPGEPVTLRFDAPIEGAHVQVGAWRDPQSFPQRVRMRTVIRREPIDGTAVVIATPVGGPIYVDLPPGLDRPTVTVRIDGAVPAPHFRLGATDEGEWIDTIRFAPAPWAELETDNLVITIPSETVRDLENPVELMEHWDRIHDAMHELEPRQSTHWADRQFRYVADRKLSWGYMYCPADGPIVVPTSAADQATDLEFIRRPVGDATMWGWYHEMGHAHQSRMWTFNGLSEVTVNIFTVYALDRVLGVDPTGDRARMGPDESRRRYEVFRESDRAFPGDPFTGLAMYALVWEDFGWEPFHDVFAEYRALPDAERPASDQDKRDQWLVRLSNAVGRDLGPYFDSWRVGVSDDAKARVAHLPDWMPTPAEQENATP